MNIRDYNGDARPILSDHIQAPMAGGPTTPEIVA